MYRRNNYKIYIIGSIAFSVVALTGLIYAAFTGQLNITGGKGYGRDSKWDIQFDNVSTITTTQTAKVIDNKQPKINQNNPNIIDDYEISLTSPGDTISFTFDAVNNGNYDAKITSIDIDTPNCTSTDNESATNMCNNLTYTLTYASGATVQTNDVLYAKDKLSFKVTLTFNDISDPNLLPKSGVSISNLGIQINFEQESNALVKDDGTVANYRVYHQGDKITLNNEDYYVIADSGADKDYVTLFKLYALTSQEVNNYGIGYINRYTQNSIGTTNSGIVAFYSSETCGYVNGSLVTTNCITNYDESDIKHIVDDWANNVFNSQLKEVDGYKARLLTYDEATGNNDKYKVTNSVDYYWTMTIIGNNNVRVVYNYGTHFSYYTPQYNTQLFKVRPVINVYKSALETNNNE